MRLIQSAITIHQSDPINPESNCTQSDCIEIYVDKTKVSKEDYEDKFKTVLRNGIGKMVFVILISLPQKALIGEIAVKSNAVKCNCPITEVLRQPHLRDGSSSMP